ncbi:MAG: molybdopterin-dependent oxidoreductase [Armatimonadota bacterium]|nr:molybdopterin-dependent oxidoreductase [Armatimonadota bacterium]MDR7520508.1 molybdopterin-dependent oxidoreductase [Armatimonadota bacterium]MDR7550211.1 molybdopterin-dependent oxidoreductase [Armatimonadota bacterium]
MAKKTPARTTRRRLLASAALLGGAAAYGRIAKVLRTPALAEAAEAGAPYPYGKPENTLYSVCLQCNTGCSIKVYLERGVAVKIEGNPLSPWTMAPHLPYRTPVADLAGVNGTICPKGQAGLQTVYDPYRIRTVLKRAGPRGSNRWKTITWEQAINEITNGGRLFADIPGEEHRVVEGFKDVWALRDPALARAMAADVALVKSKRMTVEQFKARYRAHLHVLIDPDHPDLGPKNNQFVYWKGREKGGRGDFVTRFAGDAFGTVNRHGHTTVCQGSLYFTGKAMSDQYRGGTWTGGRKFYWQADTEHAEFIIFVGANPLEANYGPPLRAGKVTGGIVSGRLKIAVVDPRFSRSASKAWKWIPNRPGTEAAVALAMIRWIIEQRRFDAKYLANANRAAAAADGEPTWSNASWLVKIEDHQPGKFLRAAEIGLSDRDLFVVFKDGTPVAVDPYDTRTPVEGDLLVDTVVGGVRVKSALQVLYDEARKRSIAGWAALAGVSADDLIEVAREFTSHGKRAAVDLHRGCSQHTNGFYNCFTWYALNTLIGNYDWKGGSAWASAYDQAGGRPGAPFNVRAMHPGRTTAFGTPLIRNEEKYEDSTLFSGYPARRQWYPMASDIYQELLPSAAEGYPYPIKILLLYMGSPAYALPAGHTTIEILADPTKIPLVIACDILIGTTSMYADYIFPDLTYLERWEFHGTHPSVLPKVQPIYSPVIAPLTRPVRVFGEEMPASFEALMLAIAERLGLPGFGPDGFGPGQPLTRPDDFYVRLVANVAFGDRPGDEVPDASPEEERLFLAARAHLPTSVFDPDRWRAILGERWWKKLVFVLNRGGRFADYDSAFDGERLRGHYGNLVNLYLEKLATTKHALTGRSFSGAPGYHPIADSLGRPIRDEAAGYELHLITNRIILHTKSRTITNYWLTGILPENHIVMHPRDARARNLKDGDRVRIVSATNPSGEWDLRNGQRIPMVGRLKVSEGIRPGVIAFPLGYGHWATGAVDVLIDGRRILGDPRRRTGIHGNAAFRTDPQFPNTCLTDMVGASAVFYDTKVKVVPA